MTTIPFPALSSKVHPQVDKRERSLGASVVLDVPEPRVERQVFCHLLVCVEVNGIEARAPGLGFRKLKQGPSKPSPAMGGMNSDVVDKESLIGNREDDHTHDGSVALGDGHVMVTDDLRVIVGHR